MNRTLLTIFLLVNGSMAVTFGVFYGLVKLSLAFNVSPWFAALALVGMYVAFIWRECGRAL